MTTTGHASRYTFDNASPEAQHQLRRLAEVLDPHSTAVLASTGVGPGWRCLDLGSGAGSIAGWLADQVGPHGHVTSADLKPQIDASTRDNLTVIEHDLRSDSLPAGGYDLIHARLLLMHLPEREDIVSRLAATLAPGGVLVVSDWDCTDRDLVVRTPDPAWAQIFDTYDGLLLNAIEANGADLRWARYVPDTFRDAGLVDVTTAAQSRIWHGGTTGCALHISNSHQLEERLLADGMTAEQLEILRTALADPGFAVRSWLMLSTTGRRRDPHQ